MRLRDLVGKADNWMIQNFSGVKRRKFANMRKLQLGVVEELLKWCSVWSNIDIELSCNEQRSLQLKWLSTAQCGDILAYGTTFVLSSMEIKKAYTFRKLTDKANCFVSK